MMNRAVQTGFGTVLSIAAAVAVTAQAFNAPPKPRKAQDLVVTEGMQPQFAAICQMYPGECRFNADGSVARVTGRRVAQGTTDRSVLRHFQTEIGTVDPLWGNPSTSPRNPEN
jgi:hypothetical protein